MNVARLARFAALAAAFTASWLLVYMSPSGPLAGLAADDFFYLARAWRLLSGELPDRDFVDPGSPLTLVLSAATQLYIGRGAWSEVVLSATAIAIGSTVTCWVAFRASGSAAVALLAALLPAALGPRLFSYPPVLVDSLAVAGLLVYSARPSWRSRSYLALVTVAGILLRHDHGILIAVATLACAAYLPDLPAKARRREAVSYGVLLLLLVAPYLAYLQANGGIASHVLSAFAWSSGDLGIRSMSSYLLLATPVLAVTTLAVLQGRRCLERHCLEPSSKAFVVSVAILGAGLNVLTLRGHAAALADVAVPNAVLLAWSIGTWAFIARGAGTRDDATRPIGAGFRAAAIAIASIATVATSVVVVRGIDAPARRLRLVDAPSKSGDAIRDQTYRLMSMWPLEAWSQRLTSGPTRIAFYLRDCTLPTQTVFIADDLPQLTALAERPFSGGHPGLRPGSFATRHDQELTIARLERDQVALVMAPIAERYEAFRASFPLLDAYLTKHYERLLTRVRGRDIDVDLLVRKDPTAGGWNLMATGWYEPMRWPCFRRWHSEHFTD